MANKTSDLREMAKLAELCDRFEDMAKSMKELFENVNAGDVTEQEEREDRNLLSVAYKNVVGSKRTALRILQNIERQDATSKKDMKQTASNMLPDIRDELKSVCMEVIDLVKERKLSEPSSDSMSGENAVFYNKLVGDYYRYLCEACGDQYSEQDSETEEFVKNRNAAKEAYQEASKHAEQLAPTNPIRLGLALNASVFYYEIMKETDAACKQAKKAFDEAISELDQVQADSYKDSTLIMQLLRDNLTLWSSSGGDGNDDRDED